MSTKSQDGILASGWILGRNFCLTIDGQEHCWLIVEIVTNARKINYRFDAEAGKQLFGTNS